MSGVVEHEIPAHEVRPGDYLGGLGRVQSFTDGGGRVTLASEFDLWRVNVNRYHRVTVIR